MKTRILTSFVIFAFFIPFVAFSHTLAYPIMVSVLSLIAAFELLRTFSLHKSVLASIPAYLLCGGMPILAYFMKKNAYDFLLTLFLIMFACMIYFFAVSVFAHSKYKYSKLAGMYVFLMYIVLSFSALSLIRNLENNKVGLLTFLFVFFISWSTDIFAYFTGYFFGKHKLSPVISPKKTVEGAIGGTLLCTGTVFLLAFLATLIFTDVKANYISIAIFTPLLSIVAQIGDLFASAVKREYEVKDFGSLLPGHGGIIDRFDSVLAVTTPLLVITLLYPMFI